MHARSKYATAVCATHPTACAPRPPPGARASPVSRSTPGVRALVPHATPAPHPPCIGGRATPIRGGHRAPRAQAHTTVRSHAP
eukprot:4123288-Prymnesium_polylepis.1